MAAVEADADVALVARWAAFYRSRGFNPLPMRRDAKRPAVRFSQWWDEPAPTDLFDRFPTVSVQVMTGRRWRLLVLDLDGPEARDWFAGLGRPVPRTWATHSGGDGLHLWFRLPPGLREPISKALLWRGDGKHAAAERLCDRSLVVAPPSIHPETGRRYRFLSKGQSPARLPMPAPCPMWLLAMPVVREPCPEPPSRPARPRPATVPAGRFLASEVLDAIPDKVAQAEEWGLRVASRRESSAGWCQCHAIGREDRRPSASISATTGRYWEPGRRTIGLFDLAVQLGAYLDWRDAVSDLGRRYHVREAV